MRTIIEVELWLAAILAAVFLSAYGRPWRWRDTTYAWHIAAFTAVVLALVGLLLAAINGLHVPAWLAVTVLGGLDCVLAWRLILFHRSR